MTALTGRTFYEIAASADTGQRFSGDEMSIGEEMLGAIRSGRTVEIVPGGHSWRKLDVCRWGKKVAFGALPGGGLGMMSIASTRLARTAAVREEDFVGLFLLEGAHGSAHHLEPPPPVLFRPDGVILGEEFALAMDRLQQRRLPLPEGSELGCFREFAVAAGNALAAGATIYSLTEQAVYAVTRDGSVSRSSMSWWPRDGSPVSIAQAIAAVTAITAVRGATRWIGMEMEERRDG